MISLSLSLPLSLSYFLELKVGGYLWVFEPLGLNSLEGIVWTSTSWTTNFILTNPALEELSYLECSGVLVHVGNVSISLFLIIP